MTFCLQFAGLSYGGVRLSLTVFRQHGGVPVREVGAILTAKIIEHKEVYVRRNFVKCLRCNQF